MKILTVRKFRLAERWKSMVFLLNPLLVNSVSLRLLLTSSFFLPSFFLHGQSDIPIGAWRIHTAYHSINSLALGDQKVFAAAHHGVMLLDQSDNSISSYTKLNGLTGTTITYINYDGPTHLLLIAYADGNFDVINSSGEILSFDPTKNSAFTGSRTINHIFLQGGFAYLSADYGVIVFDLTRLQVKETWRDLGTAGETLRILQSTYNDDSIFLATERGVLAGDVNDNLLDFNNWKRFDIGEFNGPVQSISAFNGTFYVGINDSGIHHYENGIWIKETFLQGVSFQSINASFNSLLIAEQDTLWEVSIDHVLSQVTGEGIDAPRFAMQDSKGNFWVGDGKNGLVSDVSGSFLSYLPNSPSNEGTSNLVFHEETMYALAGGFSASSLPLGNPGDVDLFRNGTWTTENSNLLDLTDRVFNQSSDNVYSSSFGFGLEVRDGQGNVKVFDESNSPLMNSNPPGRFVYVTSLGNSADGLWVANYGAAFPLHLLRNSNTWESFSFVGAASRYPLSLVIDFEGSVWMVLNPAEGGGILVFNKDENATSYLTDAMGSGGLPSKSVHAIAIDRDGIVWVGTAQGVAYFMNPGDVFSTGVDAIKPIFEDRFLLRDDKITAIAVDGGNRKWIGTERGVWLFNPTGEELVYHFTAENSPLLSNIIRDIEINRQTGEVFFATGDGLVSFRGGATESNFAFQSVKVFPNPVTANFVGTVGISGLATDAIVKITDIGGKLIWQTQANGGTATWNVQDYTGRRAPTGIYIIFAATQDGAAHVVAKIAVVE